MERDLDIVKSTSNNITHNNDTLTRELTVLSRKLDETIQINSVIPSRFIQSILTLKTQIPPPSAQSLLPSSPPPPPNHLSTSTITNSRIYNQISLTPAQKCPTTLTKNRPVITIEDLRKITLKKATPINKENNGKNNLQTLHGLAISLDMWRSVKLKLTKRSGTDVDVKN